MRALRGRSLRMIPRVLGVCMSVFLALFALDVFGAGYTPWQSVWAFAIHLLPALVVAGAVAIAWRWELAGGAIFIGLAALYVIMAWGRFPLATYIVIAGPLVVAGVLFLIVSHTAGGRGR
jgi:hypothetical protein